MKAECPEPLSPSDQVPGRQSTIGETDANRAVIDRILSASDLEAIGEATAQKVLRVVDVRSSTFGLVDARELAEQLGVSIDYVYAHATELGAMRLGSGPKARIRFGDLQVVDNAPGRI